MRKGYVEDIDGGLIFNLTQLYFMFPPPRRVLRMQRNVQRLPTQRSTGGFRQSLQQPARALQRPQQFQRILPRTQTPREQFSRQRFAPRTFNQVQARPQVVAKRRGIGGIIAENFGMNKFEIPKQVQQRRRPGIVGSAIKWQRRGAMLNLFFGKKVFANCFVGFV